MKEYKIRITDIGYDISAEDIAEYAEYHGMNSKDEHELESALEALEDELPASIESSVRCNSKEEIEDFCADIVTDATGYLINSCSFEILEEKG